MADSRKLTGYSWHSEFLKRDEFNERRHSRRCIYFFKNDGSKQGYCRKGHIKCIGSSHCDYYEENVNEINDVNDKEKSENTKIILPPPKKETCMTISWSIGDKVRHKKFGFGTIVAIKGDCLTIQFSNMEYGKKIFKANSTPISKI